MQDGPVVWVRVSLCEIVCAIEALEWVRFKECAAFTQREQARRNLQDGVTISIGMQDRGRCVGLFKQAGKALMM